MRKLEMTIKFNSYQEFKALRVISTYVIKVHRLFLEFFDSEENSHKIRIIT